MKHFCLILFFFLSGLLFLKTSAYAAWCVSTTPLKCGSVSACCSSGYTSVPIYIYEVSSTTPGAYQGNCAGCNPCFEMSGCGAPPDTTPPTCSNLVIEPNIETITVADETGESYSQGNGYSGQTVFTNHNQCADHEDKSACDHYVKADTCTPVCLEDPEILGTNAFSVDASSSLKFTPQGMSATDWCGSRANEPDCFQTPSTCSRLDANGACNPSCDNWACREQKGSWRELFNQIPSAGFKYNFNISGKKALAVQFDWRTRNQRLYVESGGDFWVSDLNHPGWANNQEIILTSPIDELEFRITDNGSDPNSFAEVKNIRFFLYNTTTTPQKVCLSNPNNITLYVQGNDDRRLSEMRFSNDGTNWSAWESYKVLKRNWNLNSSSKVYVQFKDGAGNVNSDSTTNPACQADSLSGCATITGALFYDADADWCYDSGEQGQYRANPASNLEIKAGNNPCDVSNQNYTCSTVPGYQTLRVSGNFLPYLEYGCARGSNNLCNIACAASPTAGSSAVVDIGFRDWYGPWFQTGGGDVYAGASITANIPSTCIGSCQPYFSLQESGVIQSGNSINSGSGSLGENHSWPINNEALSGIKKWDYEYFLKNTYDRYPLINFDPDGLFHNPLNPTQDLESHIWELSGDMTINNPQTLDSSQKIVILVSGSLNINNNITVPSGAFLMFIVRGNINISSNVNNLQGIYLSDAQINTGTVNTQLIVSGALIADADRTNDKLSLQRDFQGNQNNTLPAEKIIYRPDFILNAPDELKKSLMVSWLETSP